MENFKDINGYEGLYLISNYGTVRSVERVINRTTGQLKIKERILKTLVNKGGYVSVKLFKNGKGESFRIHRLIAISFIINTENKDCINHIDGIKTNNSLSNLEWVTKSENTKHAFKLGIQTNNRIGKFGANNNLSKTVYQYKNGLLICQFGSRLEAERMTNISSRKIGLCCNGKRKTSGGFNWYNEAI
jgi:hypothetical protein